MPKPPKKKLTKTKPNHALVKSLNKRSDEVQIGQDREFAPIYEIGNWSKLAEQIGAIKWLIPGWLPYGMLTGLIGEPKAGKSAFALAGLVGPIITGKQFFNHSRFGKPQQVIWVDTERRAAINVKRIQDWGLPGDKIINPFADLSETFNLQNPNHIAQLMGTICKYEIPLTIVDSFRGSHTGDENKSTVSNPLGELARISEMTSSCIAVIHHTKIIGEDEEININSGRGSNAFLAAVACQIAIDRPDRNSPWRRLQILGENLGISPPPVGFTINDTGIEFGNAPTRPKKTTEKDEAAEWLLKKMNRGEEYNAGELLEEAEGLGINRRTLSRASQLIGVQSTPVRNGKVISHHCWILPPPPEEKS